jgi:hypothetical protein
MPFSCCRRFIPLRVFVGCVLLGVSMLLGCDAKVTEQDKVFPGAAQRVEDNLLPPLVDEADDVLRNFLNLLAALPEICSTRLANLGSFSSSLPDLGNPTVAGTLDDEDGFWEMTWQNVVLGSDDTQLSVDITLTIRFIGPNGQTLRAVPFLLTPQSSLQTQGEPASFAGGGTEGFFLFQDENTGVWTLRWRTLDAMQVFEGRINATALTRVVQRVVEPDPVTGELVPGDPVTSLEINDAATEISFTETTTASDNKGFTFFVRPGETVRFRLRIGLEEDTLQEITRDQLHIGTDDQQLPASDDPADFELASNLPIDPTIDQSMAPGFVPGAKLGTFIWQDIGTNACDAATEDQWRVRFSSTPGGQNNFSGTVNALDQGDLRARLRATAVGSCPVGDLEDGDRRLTYDCTLQGDSLGGYDICVSRDRRVSFSPEVDGVHDPGLVVVGADSDSPPSPDPFFILFEVELAERQSSRNLEFSDARIVLRGNNDEDGAVQLNPDQISLDPLCSVSDEKVQPRVRFTDEGDYSTDRFDGSVYTLEDVEFTDEKVEDLTDIRRFPDRGTVLLQTRVEGQVQETNFTVPAQDIQEDLNDKPIALADVEMGVNGVTFNFPHQVVNLTVE